MVVKQIPEARLKEVMRGRKALGTCRERKQAGFTESSRITDLQEGLREDRHRKK